MNKINKVKFGLKNAHYAVDNAGTYDTPVPLSGSVNLSLSPKGEKAEFYADDVLYFTKESNQGYEGEIEIADLPTSFLKDCLGFSEDVNGAIFEASDAKQTPFALMFEVDGDEVPRRFVFYNCLAARPSIEGSTKESSTEPKTDSLSFVASPRATDGKVKAVLIKSVTNESVYAGFFTSVYEFVEEVTP